jgi:hypothetical protein
MSASDPHAAARAELLVSLERARRALRPGLVEIGALRRLLGESVPRAALDECLLGLERSGGVALIPHACPERLERLERQDGVHSPRGLLYFVVWHD